ncbi:F-box domain [Dillenia turbinata]|uniref:F-box domain n=1 Tax=Dillenia turbinata TaxID=194707 RepID=A0AAN8VQU0_9MAGN
MTSSEDEDDQNLAHFLESEVLSLLSDSERDEHHEHVPTTTRGESAPPTKRLRLLDSNGNRASSSSSLLSPLSLSLGQSNSCSPRQIESGIFSKIPPELFHHILKFLSSEDLVACSLVCSFLNYAASDESLWRRLKIKAFFLVDSSKQKLKASSTKKSYYMRWGLLPPTRKLREFAWKKLYIQRDEEDMVECVRNCPPEFKEYYIQMQAAKRSQAPLPSQVNDDQKLLDKTVSDQVSMWKISRGLSDKVVADHACSGETCSFYQIGDAFVCEKTGHVHVCDDTCREVVFDPANGHLVCTISGHCFDRLLSPAEMELDAVIRIIIPYNTLDGMSKKVATYETQTLTWIRTGMWYGHCTSVNLKEQQQGGVTDEAEPFMGSGRFARAYLLGYNCADERELEAALRFC